MAAYQTPKPTRPEGRLLVALDPGGAVRVLVLDAADLDAANELEGIGELARSAIVSGTRPPRRMRLVAAA